MIKLFAGFYFGENIMQSCNSLVSVLLYGVLFMANYAMAASSLGGRLVLEDEGSFFVNGRTLKSEHPGASLVTGRQPPGTIIINQMYVHYRIPADKKQTPVVMVHGSGHTGMT